MSDGDGSSLTPEGVKQSPQHRSVVAWISGHDAARMEMASEAEFQQEIHSLLDEFPAMKFPSSFKVMQHLQKQQEARSVA